MKKLICASSIAMLLSITAHSQTVIASWSYDAGGTIAAPYNTNLATGGANMSTAWVTQLGMSNNYTFNGNEGPGSYPPNCDVLATAGASTGAGAYAWRVRGPSNAGGGGPGQANGWNSQAPIGTQGAEFYADTTTYNNITITVDINSTTQGSRNLAVLYTTNDSVASPVWFNATITSAGSQGTLANNSSSPNTVTGNFVELSAVGTGWNNQITAICALAGNDPDFAVEVVNASTGADCVNGAGNPLNNSSGNWRYDNIIITGTVGGGNGLTPPTLNPTNATVDQPFTNTFPDSALWRASITGVTVNGKSLLGGYTVFPGYIVFTPSLSSPSSLLQKSGTATIEVYANNYNPSVLSQYIGPGTARLLTLSTQPLAPTGNGGTLVTQPTLAIADQYGNAATNNATGTYTATPSAGWSFGPGSAVAQPLANGECQFTNLSAISAGAVSGATITFTVSGGSGLGGLAYTTTNSVAFNIPAPRTTGFAPGNLVVEQCDVASSANSTFSMIELNPDVSNSAPVNIYPIPATGTNALRQSSQATTGRLADSDDHTLLCFSASQWGDSTFSDITALTNRGAGTLNSQGNFALPATYQSIASEQSRSAVTVDNTTFYMGDKSGVYTNDNTPANAYIGYTPVNQANVRSLKSYNGTIYVLQQYGGTDPNALAVAILPQPPEAPTLTGLEGLPIDGSVLDFYALASGAHGTNIDVIYLIDGTNNTSGALSKYTNSFTIDVETGQQVWGPVGPYVPTPNGGDGLCAATNSSGGVDLYYTTGPGGLAGNSVVHAVDSAAWNQQINLTSMNVIYTASSNATLKGIAFAPVTVTNGITIYPIGNLGNTSYASSGANKGFTFSFSSGNGASASFTVWSSTNVTLPFNQWHNLGHPTEAPAGTYSYTDASGATHPYTFYRVTSP